MGDKPELITRGREIFIREEREAITEADKKEKVQKKTGLLEEVVVSEGQAASEGGINVPKKPLVFRVKKSIKTLGHWKLNSFPCLQKPKNPKGF